MYACTHVHIYSFTRKLVYAFTELLNLTYFEFLCLHTMPSTGAIATIVVLFAVPLIIYLVSKGGGGSGSGSGSGGGGGSGGSGSGGGSGLCGGIKCGVNDMVGKPWCLNEVCVGCRSNSDCAMPQK